MTKNGADAKAHRYFDIKAQIDALKKDLEKAKVDLIEVSHERVSPIYYDDTEVVVTEYFQNSVGWKDLYSEAYGRLGRTDRKFLKEMEEDSTKVSERVKITRKPFKISE